MTTAPTPMPVRRLVQASGLLLSAGILSGVFGQTALAEVQVEQALHAAPAAVAALPDLEAVTTVGELTLFGSPASDLLWAEDPRTGAIIAAYGFDSSGRNMNQAHPAMAQLGLADFLAVKAGGENGDAVPPAAVDSVLQSLDPEQRDAALSDLIERMRGVQDEAGFNKAAAAWIDGLGVSGEAQSTLLQVMVDARIVEAGAPEHRAVYMLTDPLCLPCGTALQEAMALVEAGEISLRIVLAPMVSDDSHGVIAGILAQEDPLKALLEIGNTEAPVPFAPYAYLDADSQEALAFNRAIATSGAIEEIPLFAWETDGAEVYSVGLNGFTADLESAEAQDGGAEAAVMPDTE